MKKGLVVVLDGPDGVGKSRQMELIEERLREQGVMYRRLRYPIYDLKPTGSRLDEMLHKNKKPLEEEKMQELFAQNRRDFEPTLRSWLDSGGCGGGGNYTGRGLGGGAGGGGGA